MYDNEEYIFQILRAGASAYILKKSPKQELLSAIRAVYKGNSFLSPSISKKVIKEYLINVSQSTKMEILSNREREVLQLIAEGMSGREIAENLCISKKTVEVHRTHIMEKLNIHGTAKLTRYAVSRGLISPDT